MDIERELETWIDNLAGVERISLRRGQARIELEVNGSIEGSRETADGNVKNIHVNTRRVASITDLRDTELAYKI